MTPRRFLDQLLSLFFLWTLPGTIGAILLAHTMRCAEILCGVE